LISDSLALSQTPVYTTRPQIQTLASASRGVIVLALAVLSLVGNHCL